jgi:hypothetical protein
MGRSHTLRWLLAAVLALAATAVVAGCGSDDEQADANPRSLLATAAAKKIESADVSLRADANIPNFPVLGSRLIMTGDGPIVANGPGALPDLDWKVLLRAGGQSFPMDLTAVDGGVYLTFMGVPYEVEPELLDKLGISAGSGPAPVSLKQLGIDPDGWLTNVEVSDGEEIGGDSTKLVTGTVDKQAVTEDLLAVIDTERLRSAAEDVEGVPDLSADNADEVAAAVKTADVEVNVDGEGYPRRVYAKLRFEVPKSVENRAYDGGTIAYELVLDQIGDVTVDAEAPVDADPFSSLVKFAGVIFGIDELSDLWTVPR